MPLSWKDRSLLITGGTGSFGQALVEAILAGGELPRRLIVFSRDELKQQTMRARFPEGPTSPLRYVIGNVRDRDRLARAFHGVDVVVHAAALKQAPSCENNPLEAIRTNVLGAANVIDAALDQGVERVVALSTDKAANPISVYGASKLCADKLFVAGNDSASAEGTRFSVVRYGNVIGSRGSVIPLFLEARKTKVLPITDVRMTRFWITLQQAVAFVLDSLGSMRGGEVFIPKIPSMRLSDLAKAVAPDCELNVVGIRPGEKLHEVMLPADDARSALELEDRYVLLPAHPPRGLEETWLEAGGRRCPDGFCYSSDTNSHWLTVEELRNLAGLTPARDR